MAEEPELPGNVSPAENAAPAVVPPPEYRLECAPPPPERYPFWGYADLLLFAGLAVPCMLLGWAVVRAVFAIFRYHSRLSVAELLPQQLLGYGLLFGALALIFRMQYDRPFWKSLAWCRTRMPFLWTVIFGFSTAIAVAMLGALIRTPTTSNQMTQLMEDRVSMILMAAFGTTVAPLSEELIFRGFLQPLLVRSLGAVAGIAIAALPFGLLHYHEYGNSWRHAVLIALAGASFGVMRHVTGSTRAAAIMHAAYNTMIFIAVLGQGRLIHHP